MNVYDYSLVQSSADFTVYTPGIGTCLISGENSAFAHFVAAVDNHYNLALWFGQVSIIAG